MNRVLGILAVCVIAATLAAGFAIVGGPKQARAEKADRKALVTLREVMMALECSDGTAGALPNDLSEASLRSYCGGRGWRLVPRTTDDLTYERMSDRAYRLCVPYTHSLGVDEVAQSLPLYDFDPHTGCMQVELRP